MLFSVGSLHDKSRQQATGGRTNTSFSRHASHFNQSYVKTLAFMTSFLGTFFKGRLITLLTYLTSLRLLTFFQDKEDSALLTPPLLR